MSAHRQYTMMGGQQAAPGISQRIGVLEHGRIAYIHHTTPAPCQSLVRVAPEFTKKSWMPAYAGMTSLRRKPESSPLLVPLPW